MLLFVVGGIFGVPFLTAAISQEIKDQLVPDGAIPIAAYESKPTNTSARITTTSATFALTSSSTGIQESI